MSPHIRYSATGKPQEFSPELKEAIKLVERHLQSGELVACFDPWSGKEISLMPKAMAKRPYYSPYIPE